MSQPSKHLYEFGPFHLDPVKRILLREGEPVPLAPKAFDTLLVLIQSRERGLDKDELIATLWPDTIVEEANLTVHISTLRKALGEDPNEHRYIVTIPGRGYRFVADVREAQAEEIELILEDHTRAHVVVEEESERVPKAGFLRGRRASLYGGVAILLAGLMVAGFYFFPGRSEAIDSLAVLPLANLSADPEQEYFTDGMTEALISELGKIEALKVISRRSVMAYKEVRKPLSEIARELSVDVVVEGSVLRAGDRVRITAELTEAATGRLLWTKSYERDLRDVLTLQSEVAQAIAREIQVTLTPEEQALLGNTRPVDPEAYEAYLKGRYFWNKRFVKGGLQKAREYFRQAIDEDPRYAPAYTGLADTYSVLGYWAFLPPQVVFPQAKAAAEKALEIDDTLAEAHASVGVIRLFYDWDWSEAESRFKRAIELNPSYQLAHVFYGHHLSMLARFDEAIAQFKQAQALDPLSLSTNANLGWTLYLAREYEPAMEELRRTLELDPNSGFAHFYIGYAYKQTGKEEEAIAEFQKAVDVSGGFPWAAESIGYIYARMGERDKARKILDESEARWKREYVPATALALIYLGLGDDEKVFEWLNRAYEQRSPAVLLVVASPEYDRLRPDPRFQDLLRRMGLAP